jgi:hypothetical protein
MIRLSLRWRLSLALAAVLLLLLCLDVALTLRGAGRRIDPEVANATKRRRGRIWTGGSPALRRTSTACVMCA